MGTYHYLGWCLGSQVLILVVVKKVPVPGVSVQVHKLAEVVLCSEYLRPRVLYSQKKVSFGERMVVRRTLEEMLYSYGSKLDIEPVILGGDPSSAATVFTRVMVRLNITCSDPVEVPYYSSVLRICVHCACKTQCTIDGQYPICNECIHDGKPLIFKRKRKLSKS